jgi:hypothetical protein
MMHEFTSSHAHMEEVTVTVKRMLFQIDLALPDRSCAFARVHAHMLTCSAYAREDALYLPAYLPGCYHHHHHHHHHHHYYYYYN